MEARQYPEFGAGQTKLEEDYCDEQSNPCQHGIINDLKLSMMMMMMMTMMKNHMAICEQSHHMSSPMVGSCI